MIIGKQYVEVSILSVDLVLVLMNCLRQDIRQEIMGREVLLFVLMCSVD